MFAENCGNHAMHGDLFIGKGQALQKLLQGQIQGGCTAAGSAKSLQLLPPLTHWLAHSHQINGHFSNSDWKMQLQSK